MSRSSFELEVSAIEPAADLLLNVLNIDELIGAARHGAPEALEQLLAAYQSSLLIWAQQALGPDVGAKACAPDVLQLALQGARRNFAAFHGLAHSEFRAWLHHILVDSVADFQLHHAADIVHPTSCQASHQVDTEREFDISEEIAAIERSRALAPKPDDARRLKDALGRLAVRYRLVIRLRHKENRSFAEIGRLIERTPEAARRLWLRALLRLGAELERADEPQ